MSDKIMSPYSYFSTKGKADTGNINSLYRYSVAPRFAAQGDGNIAPQLSVQPSVDVLPSHDMPVAEAAVRQMSKDIEHAKVELGELEQALAQELKTPSVQDWLLPLMVIGQVFSLYGSFASTNSAELGATGLILLWSLSAFWIIHSHEKQREMTRQANQAEIEIWSSRIEELERSLEQHFRTAAKARKDLYSHG